MKPTLRIALLLSFACAAIAGVSSIAQAQRIDFGFAVSGLHSASASSGDCPTGDPNCAHQDVSVGGGTYLGFNGDVLFWHNLGFGAEINWLASQRDYAGQGFNYRPIFYNFNAVYSSKVAPRVYVDLVAGIGAEDTHYYTGTVCGIYTCSNYQGISHFDGDFGGGLKLFATHNIFIRPEARVYVIRNNAEFSSNIATRYGATLGFSFR
ncbi:MAG: outer membrane beta-barrel protein [Terriglobales bacterium]